MSGHGCIPLKLLFAKPGQLQFAEPRLSRTLSSGSRVLSFLKPWPWDHSRGVICQQKCSCWREEIKTGERFIWNLGRFSLSFSKSLEFTACCSPIWLDSYSLSTPSSQWIRDRGLPVLLTWMPALYAFPDPLVLNPILRSDITTSSGPPGKPLIRSTG